MIPLDEFDKLLIVNKKYCAQLSNCWGKYQMFQLYIHFDSISGKNKNSQSVCYIIKANSSKPGNQFMISNALVNEISKTKNNIEYYFHTSNLNDYNSVPKGTKIVFWRETKKILLFLFIQHIYPCNTQKDYSLYLWYQYFMGWEILKNA